MSFNKDSSNSSRRISMISTCGCEMQLVVTMVEKCAGRCFEGGLTLEAGVEDEMVVVSASIEMHS
jgi:hypothetical protein